MKCRQTGRQTEGGEAWHGSRRQDMSRELESRRLYCRQAGRRGEGARCGMKLMVRERRGSAAATCPISSGNHSCHQLSVKT